MLQEFWFSRNRYLRGTEYQRGRQEPWQRLLEELYGESIYADDYDEVFSKVWAFVHNEEAWKLMAG